MSAIAGYTVMVSSNGYILQNNFPFHEESGFPDTGVSWLCIFLNDTYSSGITLILLSFAHKGKSIMLSPQLFLDDCQWCCILVESLI